MVFKRRKNDEPALGTNHLKVNNAHEAQVCENQGSAHTMSLEGFAPIEATRNDGSLSETVDSNDTVTIPTVSGVPSGDNAGSVPVAAHNDNTVQYFAPSSIKEEQHRKARRKCRIRTTWNVVKGACLVLITVALLKIAFVPGSPAADEDGLQPSASFDTQSITVTRGDISNELNVKAVITNDAAIALKSTADGKITKVYAANGAEVQKNQDIFQITYEDEQATQQKQDALQAEYERLVRANPDAIVEEPGTVKPVVRTAMVTAPVDGKLSVDAVENQSVTTGMTVASVLPKTFIAKATLTPQQMYRLQDLPTEARISIKDGPPDFTCTNVSSQAAAAAAKPAQSDESNSDSGASNTVDSQLQIMCVVPGDIKVFSGLNASMTLTGGSVENALIVPVTAVKGQLDTGEVWVLKTPGDTNSAVKQSVEVGLSDGTHIEIKKGLKEDDEVLEFVPQERNKKDEKTDGKEKDADSANASGKANADMAEASLAGKNTHLPVTIAMPQPITPTNTEATPSYGKQKNMLIGIGAHHRQLRNGSVTI
ncbi:MAG: hypothetical protein Q4P66_00940 [Actinomycetaceae bacterium]|nr:hypothetical protein [Actinomycetaceae bacterium]